MRGWYHQEPEECGTKQARYLGYPHSPLVS